MAVGANTYGTVAGVEKLVGDLVASRTFGAGTVPTLAQVEGILDDVASDLNRELESAGYTVPVTSVDATALAFLRASNNYGAAAVVLGMLPFGGFNPDAAEDAQNRAEMYQGRLNHALKMVKEQRLKAAMTTQRLANVFAGSQEDEDGNEKLPLFKRDDDFYPGGWKSFTE